RPCRLRRTRRAPGARALLPRAHRPVSRPRRGRSVPAQVRTARAYEHVHRARELADRTLQAAIYFGSARAMDEATFHELLQRGKKHNASDALFKVGQPPAFRVAGALHYLQGDKLRPEHTQALAEIVLRQSRHHGELRDFMECDTAYSVSGVGRYRVSVYRQRCSFALALRS